MQGDAGGEEMTAEQAATARKRMAGGHQTPQAFRFNWKQIGMLFGALVLFVVGLQLIQAGVSSFSFLLRAPLNHQSPVQTLGLGWLASYLLLSGTPVVAAALTLFDSGALGEVQMFTMIVGSRFGAIFVTLNLGLFYYLLGKHTKQSLAVGVLAWLTTFWLALGSLLLAFLLLPVARFEFGLPFFFSLGLDSFFEPFIRTMTLHLPSWAVVTNGFVWLMLSLRIADFALPNLDATPDPGPVKLRSPLAMFFLGLGVAMLFSSVTISFGLLVPLYAKGCISAHRLIPYVMGANISTFSGTLLAALLLHNATAVHVVMTEIISISVVALIILVAGFSRYEGMIEKWTDYFTESPKRLVQFLALTFFIPLILLIV